MKSVYLLLFGFAATFVFLPFDSYAASAGVLPKGNFAFDVSVKHYLPWDERYNKDGDVEDAATDYNAVLDSSIFPDLALFDGLVLGDPNVGTTVTSFEYNYDRIDATLAYGLTDNLTIGAKVPYIWYKNKVQADIDTSNANIGKNNLFQLGVLPVEYDSLPLLPIGAPGLPPGTVTALTADDVQSLLGSGLTINDVLAVPGYGYDRFETWEEDGFGDIELGIKYRYFKNDDWQFALLGGVLLPTGKGHDPDKLQAQILGGDCYALVLRTYHDYTGIKNLTLNGSLYYSWTLPHHNVRRIVADPREPLSPLKESVKIDPGDIFEVESSAKYQFSADSTLEGFSFELLYHFTKYFKDDVSGSLPDSAYDGLEKETDGEEHSFIASISYSTIQSFLKKEFPVPLDLSLTYRNKFKGNNSAFKTEYLQAGITLYF